MLVGGYDGASRHKDTFTPLTVDVAVARNCDLRTKFET